VRLLQIANEQGHTIILVTRTVVYDILEQMSDPAEALRHYATDLDLTWLADGGKKASGTGLPPYVRGLLVSADRDLLPADIPLLSDNSGRSLPIGNPLQLQRCAN
jgi:hypothetical protein